MAQLDGFEGEEYLRERAHLFEKVMGCPLTPDQQRVDEAIRRGDRFVLLRSANGCGKTSFLAALAAVELHGTDSPIMILALSKNETHLKRNFWASFKRYNKKFPLRASDKIPARGYSPKPDKQLVPISPNAVESAQGFHSPRTLILMDEATGIGSAVFEALISNMTDAGGQMVMAYNPVDADSYVAQLERKGEFTIIQMSALNHPNVITGQNVIPGAVTREFVESQLRIYSKPCDDENPNSFEVPWLQTSYELTPQIAVRVLGEYSTLRSDGFIEASLLTSTSVAHLGVDLSSLSVRSGRFVGVDISRGIRDKTVAAEFVYDAAGRRLVQCGFRVFYENNLSRLAEALHDAYQDCIVTVDDTGCGSGVTDRLKHLGHRNVQPVNFSNAPSNFYHGAAQPRTARTEMYLLLEKELRQGRLNLLEDLELFAELTCIKMDSAFAGRFTKVEPKAKIIKALGRSPDKADAVALGIYGYFIHRVRNYSLFS